MINLPKTDTYFPLIRFLVMPPGSWSASPQPWQVLNQPQRYGFDFLKPYGYELLTCERACLPAIGQASFMYRYGNMTATGKNNIKTVPPPMDLTGWHVRIQAAPYVHPADGPLVWRTIFLGTVDSQSDSPWTGSDNSGNRTYFCSDLLFRTNRWPLDKISLYSGNGQSYPHGVGHPGYNYKVAGFFRRLLGNKGTATSSVPWTEPIVEASSYICHAWPGSTGADKWGDDEVIAHAIQSSRAQGEPYFTLNNPGMLQGDYFSWPVYEGDKCWDLLLRVLNRQRGRGIAFLDWADDPGNTDSWADIKPLITIQPQNLNDISFKKPSTGSQVTIFQAAAQLTAIAVDLQGDHRYVDDSLQLVINDSSGVDYLETRGEPIEVLVTLSGVDGTLEKRWSASDETAFKAIPATSFWQRQSTRWRHVFQRWSIPAAWDFQAGDGNGGAKTSCHYACLSNGSIVCRDLGGGLKPNPSSPEYIPTVNPLAAKIGCDIPIYEGYNYAGSVPVRYDGAADYLSNPRNPALILIRSASNTYLNGAESLGLGMQVDDFGVIVQYPGDQAAGTRLFSGPGSSVASSGTNILAGGFDQNDLVLSVSLTLSNRVRLSSANAIPGGGGTLYDDTTAGRKLYVTIPGACLWLAHPGAIWEWNVFAASNAANPAKRNAGAGSGSVPGILRDDRDALAVTHAYAWAWYGTKRTTASWALNDCGLLPSFIADPNGGQSFQPVKYPVIGQLVKAIAAAGTTYTINTPITRCVYDHSNGVTTWYTDWQDLDTESL